MNKIINKLNSYSLNELIVEEFFDFHKLYKCGIENVYKNIRFYPIEHQDFMGIYLEQENGILKDYHAIVPRVTNLHSALINIHETMHCLMLENKIGKEYESSDLEEVIPVLYEGLFINFLIANKHYNLTDVYNEYQAYRIKKVEKSENEKKQAYVNAYLLQDELLKDFKNNPNKFLKHMREIIKNETTLTDYLNNNTKKMTNN